MISYLPGTTIEADLTKRDTTGTILGNIFLGGGLVLSQVSQMTGLEPHVIQNWVKRGFLAPPRKKLYSKDQFCRIVTINMLRDSLKLEDICGLISYVNGRLDDDSDNLLLDSELYCHYVRMLAIISQGEDAAKAAKETLNGFAEREAGAKKRVEAVLEIMYNAHCASAYRKSAEQMIKEIRINT